MSAFATLNKIDVSSRTEKKNGLTYLSWAWAWAELKKLYPASFYTVYENRDGWNYHTDGKTCWVKTGVTLVDGETAQECIEYLPVMDYKNRSIPAEQVTSFDVNKAIQRSLTKAIARHGLGLYIYAGEDLPEDAEVAEAARKAATQRPSPQPLPPTVNRPGTHGTVTMRKPETQKTISDLSHIPAADRMSFYDSLPEQYGTTKENVIALWKSLVEQKKVVYKKLTEMSDDEYTVFVTCIIDALAAA